MNFDVNALIVLVYFVFMIGIGLVFRRMASKSTSDYFRGGGQMLWWMVGASTFMTQFSAWTFTGAAGKAYSDGLTAIAVFIGNVVAFGVSWLWFAARMRQIRVDTPTEGVGRRFGPVNEQFFTWAILPLSVINAGLWLNSLSIFVAAVFKVDIGMTIWMTGLVVLFVSLLSGAWGVVASDFVQALIVAVLSVACAVVALVQVGGVGNMVANFPSGFVSGPDMNFPLMVIGTNDGNPLIAAQRQKVTLVARGDQVGVAGHCGCNDVVVVGVGGHDARCLRGCDDDCDSTQVINEALSREASLAQS